MSINKYFIAKKRLESLIGREKNSYMQMTARAKQKFFLQRTAYLCEQLGNPQLGDKNWRPQFIHIAGTAGKGSTAAMIYQILLAAGKSAGLYSSPYVTTPIENIQTNNQLISPAAFAKHVNMVMDTAEKIARRHRALIPSYAEAFWAVALNYFKEQRCAWIVVETGCGGRFDYSNIIPSPRVAVITNISLEHTNILGKTIKQIAWHKAGIIKKNCGLVTTEQNQSVLGVIKREAKKQHAKIYFTKPTKSYQTAMFGDHQQWNAAAAAQTARLMGVSSSAIATGISQTRLPARLEIIQKKPLVIIDGAHAESKMLALVNCIFELRKHYSWRKIWSIVAIKEDKNVVRVLAPLTAIVDEVYLTSFELIGFGSQKPQKVAKIWKKFRTSSLAKINIEPRPLKALQKVLQRAPKNDLVLVTGSLYLAGILRQHWRTETSILKSRRI